MSGIGNLVINTCGSLTTLANGAVNYVAEFTPSEFNEKVAEVFNHTLSLAKENANYASDVFHSCSLDNQALMITGLLYGIVIAGKTYYHPMPIKQKIGYIFGALVIYGLIRHELSLIKS